MFPIIDTRKIKNIIGNLYINVCLGKDDKEIVFYGDGYYYLSKDGLRVTRRKYVG